MLLFTPDLEIMLIRLFPVKQSSYKKIEIWRIKNVHLTTMNFLKNN